MSLIPISTLNEIVVAEEYRNMLDVISRNRPAVTEALAQHGKSHSQFQYAMLDNAGPIAGPTKLRNMRQLLAVIDRAEAAIEEAYHKRRQDVCRAEMFQERASASNGQGRLLQLKAEEIESRVVRSEAAIKGALRKLAAYYEQYAHLESQIKQELGKDEITEADFEADEERFHIMKAFEQALCAARSAGGAIDHGNFIYLHDIGINGSLAQEDVLTYLNNEQQERGEQGNELNPCYMHKLECAFLECMAKKYQGCSAAYAERKGLLHGPSAVATLGWNGTTLGGH